MKGADQQIYVVGPDWTSDFIEMHGTSGFSLNGGGRGVDNAYSILGSEMLYTQCVPFTKSLIS